jgi:hypothetical protein
VKIRERSWIDSLGFGFAEERIYRTRGAEGETFLSAHVLVWPNLLCRRKLSHGVIGLGRSWMVARTLCLGSDFESAIVATLPSGPSTVIVRGKSNPTGAALIEIYDLQ